MNPKNEPLRLSVTAARERDNPRGLVESIRAGMKTLADRIHAEQRHKPGWTPAPDYRVVAKADTYKGRDYEALTKAAKRKPVGYWEDAPRGPKFGESANGRPADFESASEGSSPSSPATIPPADDEFEPVGTVPGVGDAYVFNDGRYRTPVTFVDVSATIYAADAWARELQNAGHIWTSNSTHSDGEWYAKNGRILKRKPTAAPKLTVRECAAQLKLNPETGEAL